MPEVIRVFTLMMRPLLSLGLKSLFVDRPGFAWVDTPFDELGPDDVSANAQRKTIDLLMTDLAEELETRPDWIAGFKKNHPSLRVLVFLSAAPNDTAVLKSLRAGANGYLLQTATEEMVLRAVEAISQGGSYLQPQVTPVVLSELRKPRRLLLESSATVDLSQRERMLIQLAADGLSNVQIADVLGLREKTVRNLWSSLFEKLGMNDRTQAVLWAIRTGHAELR